MVTPSGYSQSVFPAEEIELITEEHEQMVDDIMRWAGLQQKLEKQFLEHRFDIKMVDKQTQHTTLAVHKRVEVLRMMLAPSQKKLSAKRESTFTVNKSQLNLDDEKNAQIMSTTTAIQMKQALEDQLLNRQVKQFKGTLSLKKDVDENVVFGKEGRNKQTYALNTKLLRVAMDKTEKCDVACQADIKT